MTLITFDATTDGGLSSSVTQKTYGHPIAGVNRALRVSILCSGGDLITNVVYAGIHMNQIVKKTADGTRTIYLYELIAPPIGTSNVVIDASGSTNITSHAVSYNNAAQLGQPDATATHQDTNWSQNATNSISITTLLDNCWITAVTVKTGAGNASANSNDVQRQRSNGLLTVDTNAPQLVAGSHSVGAVASDGSENWYWIAASLAPAIPIVKTTQMRVSVTQHNKYIAMRVNVKQTVTKTMTMKIRCYNPYTPGRLRNLEVRSIDIQKFTKDTAQAQVATALSTNLCNFLANNFNLTHIATVGLIDPVSIYPSGFVISPLTAAQYNKQWCDAIHTTGLKVVHRLTSMALEGSPNFPDWPPVNALLPGSYASVVPSTITDNFERISIGSSYVTNAVSGGFWEISYGQLAIINAGNEFSYNIAHTAANYADGVFQATVEKTSFGHDGLILCGSQKSTTPFYSGFGIHMSGTNTLSIEDIGQRDITNDTRVILATNTSTAFITGHFYNIEITKAGTHIQVKVWDVNGTKPLSAQIDLNSAIYSAGWFGFTTDGFGKVVHFDNLQITPVQDLNNYIGMVYNWIINNADTFADGDIIAPFPEFDTCQDFNSHCYFNPSASWLHAQYGQATVNFFNDLKDIEDLAAQSIGVKLKNGFTTYNFTSLQSVTDPNKYPPSFNDLDYKDAHGQTMMDKAGSIVTDWYGTTSASLFNPTGDSHPPQEMYDSLYAVWNKYHIPIFLQEWGGFRSIDLSNVAAHDQYYRDTFNAFADLNDLGALTRFSYWGAQDTGDADTGLLINSSTNWANPSLRVKGQVLQQFYQTGLPRTRTIRMKVKRSITPTKKSNQMRISNAGANPRGRLAGLTTKSIDLMKWTKDTVTNQPSDATIENIVRFGAENFNLTHLSVCFPIDPLSFYPAGFTPKPRTVVGCYQKWVDEIHARGLGVLHRPVSFGMEGDSGFLWRVDANRYPMGTATSAPTDGNSTWLGILYKWIIDNPTLFKDGDIFAPFPERTQGLFDNPPGVHSFVPITAPGIQQNYVNFFIDVKSITTTAFALIGKSVKTGYTADNYSEVRSGYLPQALYNATGVAAFDYYQNYSGTGFGAAPLSEDLDAVYYSKGKPLFWEEWGATPDMIRADNAARDSVPPGGAVMADGNGVFHTLIFWGLTAHPENRIKLYKDVFNTIADKYDQGKIIGFNYWGLWDTGENDTGLIAINGSSAKYANFYMRPEGYILQSFYNDGSDAPPSLSTKELLTDLPTNKNDLLFIYTPTETVNIALNDGLGTQINGVGYLVHQFKMKHENNSDSINLTVDVQTNILPITSTVYLQIWNTRTKLWETIGTNNSGSLGIDFQLRGIITQNLSDYYDPIAYPYFNINYNVNEITLRVYQRST